MGTAGASESKSLDAHAALEYAMQILMSALSGASLVHDVGFLDSADTGSLPMLVLADEAIAMTKRMMRGVPVNPDTLMLDLIDEVGPGRYFVAEPRSVALCRREIWVPTVLDRDSYAVWQDHGAKTTETRVMERLRHILETHHPARLPPGASDKIAALLA
jgi:trimethylamine--corrinoid protein Co-methyltransferase